jgi:hypothetical protein
MDLADETSPSPQARAQAGLILKNHLTSKDHAQVCWQPSWPDPVCPTSSLMLFSDAHFFCCGLSGHVALEVFVVSYWDRCAFIGV